MIKLQRRKDMSEFIVPFMGMVVIYMMYYLLLKPIHRRYEMALNHLLAKEIARRLYQEIHPDFTYKPYHQDDIQRQIILSRAVEEFRRLMINKKNE